MEPINAELNHVIVAPADEPVGRGTVEEVVLAGALPDEMPRILRVDAQDTAAMCFDGQKLAGGRSGEVVLLVSDRVLVAASDRRHEADAESASVGGVAEALDVPVMSAVR